MNIENSHHTAKSLFSWAYIFDFSLVFCHIFLHICAQSVQVLTPRVLTSDWEARASNERSEVPTLTASPGLCLVSYSPHQDHVNTVTSLRKYITQVCIRYVYCINRNKMSNSFAFVFGSYQNFHLSGQIFMLAPSLTNEQLEDTARYIWCCAE